MSDFQQWASSDTAPWVPVNENFEALEGASLYAENKATHSGLTYGLMGGVFKDTTKAATTTALADSTTNYIVAHLTTGDITDATTTTNWDDDTTYARVAKVTTAGGAITAVVDYRFDEFGLFAMLASGGVGGGSTQGKHSIPVMAPAIIPSASGGCAALATVATSANHPDVQSIDFDSTTQEFAQFSIAMPKSWNEGTITASFIWTHGATVTNFGVRWGLQAVAVSDDDTIDVAYGTAQEVTDTGGTTSDHYRSAETSAITVGGTPQAEDTVYFRVYRDPANGADNLAVDAKLLGVVVHITTNADTDA
jgi:hypothetical protein